ncbi:MAG: class I SAM-dependent methyltransferase [Acidimicrobiales bacterium]
MGLADGIDPDEARRRIAAHEFWYHTIDVAPGVSTPGWFDLRGVVDRLPWPEVRGRRCLDIGTFDGFFAFELERRGAAEVVAIDIEDHTLWDWPADVRPGVADADRQVAFRGPPKGEGFRLVAELTASTVEWRPLSIYDLDPVEIGEFDAVVCGSLLLHLRDPVRALEAVRSVCRRWLLSSEQIEVWLSLLGRGRPLFRLNGSGQECQWWLPNAAGHKRLLVAAGFEVVEASPPFVVEFNEHPRPRRTWRTLPTGLAVRGLTGNPRQGVLHRALLARPRVLHE